MHVAKWLLLTTTTPLSTTADAAHAETPLLHTTAVAVHAETPLLLTTAVAAHVEQPLLLTTAVAAHVEQPLLRTTAVAVAVHAETPPLPAALVVTLARLLLRIAVTTDMSVAKSSPEFVVVSAPFALRFAVVWVAVAAQIAATNED